LPVVFVKDVEIHVILIDLAG